MAQTCLSPSTLCAAVKLLYLRYYLPSAFKVSRVWNTIRQSTDGWHLLKEHCTAFFKLVMSWAEHLWLKLIDTRGQKRSFSETYNEQNGDVWSLQSGGYSYKHAHTHTARLHLRTHTFKTKSRLNDFWFYCHDLQPKTSHSEWEAVFLLSA